VPALKGFLDEVRSKSGVKDLKQKAKDKIKKIRADSSLSAPILNNPAKATDKMIDKFLRDYPGHKDEKKVKGLNKGDFATMIGNGMLSVSVTGQSIDYTSISIKNKSKRSITVTIPFGTYFAPANGGVQNMIMREDMTVSLSGKGDTSLGVKTACMNIDRSIPGGSDSFSVGVLERNSRLVRVIKLCDKKGATYSVTQAATWIVTDDPGDYALLNTLVYVGGGRAISDSDLEEAKQIVNEVGW